MSTAAAKGKRDSVVERVHEIARSLGPGGRIPPLRSLAGTLNVSVGTLVRAVETLEAQGVLESRRGSGVYVRASFGQKRLLVICDSLFMIDPSPVWGMALEGILKPFEGRSDEISVQFTSPRIPGAPAGDPRDAIPSSVWSELRAGLYSAVVLIGTESEMCWALRDIGVKSVGFGCAALHVVQMSEIDICQMGIQELVRQGCKRIAVLGVGNPSVFDVATSTLASYGLTLLRPVIEGQSKPTVLSSGLRNQIVRFGFEAALSFFSTFRSGEDGPDGVVIMDDMYAQGFLLGMRKLGFRPGDDLHIATQSNKNSPVLVGFESEIVRIEYDIEYLVRALLYGAECLMSGRPLTEFGWENAVVVGEHEWAVETQTIHPKLATTS